MKTIYRLLAISSIIVAAACSTKTEPTPGPDKPDPEDPKPEDPKPDTLKTVVAQFELTSADIISVSITSASGEKITKLDNIQLDSTSTTILQSKDSTALQILPKSSTFTPGTYKFLPNGDKINSELNFIFLKKTDNAVATKTINAKAITASDGIINLGTVDAGLEWTPTTMIALDFVKSGVFTNPFVSPIDFSQTVSKPTAATALVTSDNLVFDCNLSKGLVKNASYGLRVCANDGDQILLPRLNGLTLAAFRAYTVKEHASFMYCPVEAGNEGEYASIPSGENVPYGWTFVGTPAKTANLLEFRNNTEDQAYLEFRASRWELLYTGTLCPTVTLVSTEDATAVESSSAVLHGSFKTYKNEESTLFTCGFEYRFGDEDWKSISCNSVSPAFSASLSGIQSDTTYTVRAWAADTGNKVYGPEVSFKTPAADPGPGPEPPTALNILGIGNSWTRDAYRYIHAQATSAGVPTVVAHAYLGGSGLEDQFYGIDDLTYSYSHSGKKQVVHSSYQYWLYDGTEDPVLTPGDDVYGIGASGYGVTLESILKDRKWDVIIIQPSTTFLPKLSTFLGTNSTDPTKFSMAKFVAKIKGLLPADVAAKVKFGFMVPWSYPTGCTSHSSFVYSWNGGSSPSNQTGWDYAFDTFYAGIQDAAKKVAAAMGEPCAYFVNVGRAIYFGRQNETLLPCGYKLQRAQDNTHLAEGTSKYLASLMFAYEVLGLKPEQITYSPTNSNFTTARLAAAREVSYAAWKFDQPVAVTKVYTTSATPVSGTTNVSLAGSFYGMYQKSAADFSCGFEYKEEGGEWTSKTASKTFYEFTHTLTGLTAGKTYTVRAWASCASGKKYGDEKTVTLENSGGDTTDSTRLVLSPTVADFKSQGLPDGKAYKKAEDPGQAAFADKEFIYTHPDTKAKYSFFFYGVGPQTFSTDYVLYFGYSGSDFIFGAAGSYIKLPAVPGKKLRSVTLYVNGSKSWGIASTKEQIDNREGIAGGEKHAFNTDSYTFNLSDTQANTSYYLYSASGTAKVQMTEIVYSAK